MTNRERIKMIDRNINEATEQYRRGEIYRDDYLVLLSDAKKRIAELRRVKNKRQPETEKVRKAVKEYFAILGKVPTKREIEKKVEERMINLSKSQ